MAKLKNRARGEVFVPGFGKGTYLRFDIEGLERIETEYGTDWLGKVVSDLAQPSIKAVKFCLDVAVNEAPRTEGALDLSGVGVGAAGINAVAEAIYDALFLVLYSKTFDEKVAEETELQEKQDAEALQKRLKQVEENPLLAAAFLQGYGLAPTAPVSDLLKSDASPQ